MRTVKVERMADDTCQSSWAAAFERHGSVLVVRHKRSGKRYSFEQDVFTANQGRAGVTWASRSGATWIR